LREKILVRRTCAGIVVPHAVGACQSDVAEGAFQ
jgi:hypothetical protein